MNNRGIKISPNYRQQDWKELSLDKNDKVSWDKAINIFKDRMDGRFIKQIKVLDKNPDRIVGLYAGYAIMPLICLFIETIEQFWTGNIETKRQKSINKRFKILRKKKSEISDDSKAFFSFFQRSDELKEFFNNEEKADVFYRKIRCGLLHQGQTKGKSLIHIRANEPMVSWIDSDNIEEGISINRRKFFDEVYKVYEKYVQILEESDLNFKKKTLMKKMNYIVDQK